MEDRIYLNTKKEKPEKLKAGYDEKSPITGNYKVLVEPVEFDNVPEGLPKKDIYKICMETGYQTYWNSWKTSSPEILDNLEKQMPEHVANHKFVDGNGHVWYPMMTFTYIAALHPYIDSNNQMGWAVSKVSPIENDSEIKTHKIIKLPVETNKGMTLGLFKMENKPDKTWPLFEFENALSLYESKVNEWTESQKQNMTTNEEE
jgi:hypothetical protein